MTKTRQYNDVTDRTGLLYTKIETKLYDRFDEVQSMTKTKQDNDMIDFIGAIYTEIKTELS